jgi:hypothetical protein
MTTTNNDVLFGEIGMISLEHDPELLYWSWKVHMENAAANMATIVQPTGLLSEILTDQEWDDYAANRSHSPENNTLTIAPRPKAPSHKPIETGMSSEEIAVAKYHNDRHRLWHTAVAKFKTALIASLGPTLGVTIGPPPDGFKLKASRAIVEAVRTKYATANQMSLNQMDEVLMSPLDHVENLDKHLAKIRQHILMQATAGYAIEEYRQVRIFRKSVAGHHQIAQCLADHDRLNADPLQVTFNTITTYVLTHLPNIRAAAAMQSSTTPQMFAGVASGGGTAPKHTSVMGMTLAELQCAYSVLEYKHGNLQKNRQSNGKRNANKNQQQSGQDTKKARPNAPNGAPQSAEECKAYCHAHGYQNSHSSAECKVMSNQKQNFSEAMRKATSPSNPPGGSKLVCGRDPRSHQ